MTALVGLTKNEQIEKIKEIKKDIEYRKDVLKEFLVYLEKYKEDIIGVLKDFGCTEPEETYKYLYIIIKNDIIPRCTSVIEDLDRYDKLGPLKKKI